MYVGGQHFIVQYLSWYLKEFLLSIFGQHKRISGARSDLLAS